MSPKFTGRDVALIAIFAGITAALGLFPGIPVPISPVKITAQSLGPVLAGAIIGPRRGALSQALFLVLVAIGLPLLAGGRGGLGAIMTPAIGFLIGWVVIAYLIGMVTYKMGAPYSFVKGLLVNIVFGMIVLYAMGMVGMMAVAKLSFMDALIANAPYLPGDLIKMVVAAAVAKGVHSSITWLLPVNPQTAVQPVPTTGVAPQ